MFAKQTCSVLVKEIVICFSGWRCLFSVKIELLLRINMMGTQCGCFCFDKQNPRTDFSIYFIYVYGACLSVCPRYVNISKEARRGHQIFWHWMWVPRTNPGPLQEQQVLFTAEMSLQLLTLYFWLAHKHTYLWRTLWYFDICLHHILIKSGLSSCPSG